MKNIEKFQNTFDAVHEWDRYHASGGDKSFDGWLEDEYVEPPTTLVGVAEELSRDLKAVRGTVGGSRNLSFDLIDRFIDAVEREKKKPLRNCDKYTDLAEAKRVFSGLCDGFNENCYKVYDVKGSKLPSRCPLACKKVGVGGCFSAWLYMVCNDTKKE